MQISQPCPCMQQITLCCVWVLWVVQGAGLRLQVVAGKQCIPSHKDRCHTVSVLASAVGCPAPLSAHCSVCFPAFWSPPPSLNGTFLYSLKALYSKDLPAKERVTSFSFFYFFPSPFCSLHPYSLGSPLPSQKLFVASIGLAELRAVSCSHPRQLPARRVCLCVPFSLPLGSRSN